MINEITIAYDLQEFDNDTRHTVNTFEDMQEYAKNCLDIIDRNKLNEDEIEALDAVTSFVYNVHA